MSTNTQLDGIIGSTIDTPTDTTNNTETLTIDSHTINVDEAKHTGITLTPSDYTKELTASTTENNTITATGFITDTTTLVTLDVPYDHKDIVNNLSWNCHASYSTEQGWTVRFKKANSPGTNGLLLAVQELTQAGLNVHLTHKVISELTN